jgi:hypothetical protein
MKQLSKWTVAVVLAGCVAGGAAWAAFDQPSGEPPFGLTFSDNSAGQQFHGNVGIVFRDYDATLLRAPRFDSVTALRKGGKGEGAGEPQGGARHVFYAEYDCALVPVPDTVCGLCFDPNPGTDDDGDMVVDDADERVMDVGSATPIQLCLELLIKDDVAAMFELDPGVEVGLKDVSGFVFEPIDVDGDPAPDVGVTAADVEVTAK